MLLFVDESGDPGLRIAEGSSKYFIVVLVAFEDHDEALAVQDRITLLRKEQGLPNNYEFHFSNTKPTYRRAFLKAVAPYNFFYLGVVVDKAKLVGRAYQSQSSFYKYTCGLMFEMAKDRVSDAIVIVDGRGPEHFRRELKKYLRQRLNDDSNKRLIRKVKTEDSSRNDLLQLADMVVGSLARCYSNKKDAREFRRLIAHREMFVQFWPK